MTWLSDSAKGRDNNLNLIRALAAMAVLVSHAVPIALGTMVPEPLEARYGIALGTLAVYLFFIISGFLITASFQRSSSHRSFLLARFLRLMPALVVSLVLVTYVMGPLVSFLGAREYLTLIEPFVFFIKNLTLISIEYYLPGVFVDNPVSNVMGSIWTLRHEVAAYMLVFLIGILGGFATRLRATAALLAVIAVQIVLVQSGLALPTLLDQFLDLVSPFLVGSLLYVWRDRVPLWWPLALAAAAVFWMFGGHSGVGYWIMMLSMSYVVMWLAYVPGGFLRAYNRVGDYSYGIYIYAFPVQGLMVHLLGPQGMWENVLYSTPPTVLLSMLSWHLIEQPSMAAKPALMAWLGPRLRQA
jgi:peptidoglycan/LPS O-acetylase OafA/YrhL